MLKYLKTRGVGPADEMDMRLHSRINLITGNNGLGKTFILDLIWWALTFNWSDEPAVGRKEQDPFIEWQLSDVEKPTKAVLRASGIENDWKRPRGLPPSPGIVIYAKANGSFCVYDPIQHYFHPRQQGEKTRPFSFSQHQLWTGLEDEETEKTICRGLLHDLDRWRIEESSILDNANFNKQLAILIENNPDKNPETISQILEQMYPTLSKVTNNSKYSIFNNVLEKLSPSSLEPLKLSRQNVSRLSGDATYIPVLQMPYGDVPITLTSTAIKRILSLAYCMVWTWVEHQELCQKMDKPPETRMILLFDEIEAHLHPQWQRTILPALLEAVELLNKELSVQVVVNTHSPFVCASLEPLFDADKDQVYVLNLNDNKVTLDPWEWEKFGNVSRWLESDVFGLEKATNIKVEALLEQAASLPINASVEEVQALNKQLHEQLDPDDPFFVRAYPISF